MKLPKDVNAVLTTRGEIVGAIRLALFIGLCTGLAIAGIICWWAR